MKRTLLAVVVLAGGLVTGVPLSPAAGADPLPGGTFGPWVAYEAGDFETAVTSAELTGDGLPDVAVSSNGELQVLPGRGDGSLGAPAVYGLFGWTARSVAAGDLNGDGLADLAVTTQAHVELFHQTAAGMMTTAGKLAVEAEKVRIADVTGDGLSDLVVLGGSADAVVVFPQTPAGTPGEPVTYTVPLGGYNDLEVGDVDGDSDLDVVAMSGQSFAPNLTVLLQHEGALVVSGSYSVPGERALTNGVGVGDIDGDGRGEVVVSHGGNVPSSQLTVFEAEADGSLREGTTFGLADIPEPVEVADVDGDGYDDVVTAHSGWSQATVLYGSPSGLSPPGETLRLPYGSYDPHGLAITDLDLDGYPELLLADHNSGLLVLPNRGSTATAPEPVDPAPSEPPPVTPAPEPVPAPEPEPAPVDPAPSKPSPELPPPAPAPDRLSIQSTEVFCANVALDDLFTDDDGTTFEDQIECLAHAGITAGGPAGLPADQYGPGLVVTRAQMASFIVREIDTANRLEAGARLSPLVPYDGREHFTDVTPGSIHVQAITRLARAGIIRGGPGGRPASEFGPDLPVTRAQMASFINRAHALLTGTALATGADYFSDDDGSAHEASINAIASEGIAVGDRRTTYGADQLVTRGQMAAFLLRHLAMMESNGTITSLPA